MANVGLGIALLEGGGCIPTSYSILWVYVAFVVFLVILQVALYVVFSVIALTRDTAQGIIVLVIFIQLKLQLLMSVASLPVWNRTQKPCSHSTEVFPRGPS